MQQPVRSEQYRLFSSDKISLEGPRLTVHWQPFWPHLLNNIADVLRPEPPALPLTSTPGRFWPDVFVNQPVSWKDFGRSLFFHTALVFFIFMTGKYWIFPPPVTVQDAFDHTTLSYYKVDDVLPRVRTAPAVRPRSKMPQKGQPELAKQEIISVPPAADNAEQTIVNPPHPQILRQTQPLPNLVVATSLPAPPIAALVSSKITLPDFLIKPVQPAPKVRRTVQTILPEIPVPDALQPVVSTDDLKVKSEIKLLVSKMEPKVDAPKLTPPETSVISAAPKEEVAPPPSTQGLNGANKAAGQLMALNVRPVAPPPEIKIPNGSRAGIFAATPSGKTGAPGTPDLQGPPAEKNEAGANGVANSSGSGDATGVPSGISITGIPLNSRAVAVVASPTVLPPKPEETHIATPDAATRRLALATSPDFGRKGYPPYASLPDRKPEDSVFAGKKYYSMQLNMPNLTSAGGSWIIRFAELNDDSQSGDLSTPVVTDKVDPAYPIELMREQVEGTVILYAVIHADGTVGDVRVLQSLQQILDANACRALGRWHFRPATKNGVPVDLEAVVRIPFKARKIGF